jgi:hypothetical protein
MLIRLSAAYFVAFEKLAISLQHILFFQLRLQIYFLFLKWDDFASECVYHQYYFCKLEIRALKEKEKIMISLILLLKGYVRLCVLVFINFRL